MGQLRDRWRRRVRRARRAPLATALAGVAVATGAYVVCAPLVASRYPMITDFPFHAANASILRHYFDPAWHFREQFELQPLAVPYMSMYALAALCGLALPAVAAMKVAAGVMLALLPAGLAVLFWGMRKPPVLGVLGAGLAWGTLGAWGFLSHLGALGLFAMATGLALALAHRPTRARAGWLALVLALVLFTHPFRYPWAVVATAAAGGLSWVVRRRLGHHALALAPSVALFSLFWLGRPRALAADFGPFWPELARLAQARGHLYHTLRGAEEPARLGAALVALGVIVVTGALARRGVARAPAASRWAIRRRRWQVGSRLLVAGLVLVALGAYLTLPMQAGAWWYVYPRELTSAVYLGLALVPAAPRSAHGARAVMLALACLAVAPLGRLAAEHHRRFGEATRDFDAVLAHLPAAPKLLYLVFDHDGSDAVHTPFLHLPAYVQATRGGWLSFHFAVWDTLPIAYRPRSEAGAVVPPRVPLRWEWTPGRFRLAEHGPFFDWFLVRRAADPSALFRADPAIELVAQAGRWWLFRRDRTRAGRR
jgi:hypothetical protein